MDCRHEGQGLTAQDGSADPFQLGLSWMLSKCFLIWTSAHMSSMFTAGSQICMVVEDMCFPHLLYVVFHLIKGRVPFFLFQRKNYLIEELWPVTYNKTRNSIKMFNKTRNSIKMFNYLKLASRWFTESNSSITVSASVLVTILLPWKIPWPRKHIKESI